MDQKVEDWILKNKEDEMAQAMSVKLEGVKEALEMYDPKIVKQAIRSTLDKTATQVKQDIVEDVSTNYNIKAKEVRDAITVYRTKANDLKSEVVINSGHLQLVAYFKALQNRAGVVANISRRGLTTIKGAFINPGQTWHGSLMRKGKARYPLKTIAGPTIPDVAGGQRLFKSVKEMWERNMEKLFGEEIEKRLKP
jgi:hypothetical protein